VVFCESQPLFPLGRLLIAPLLGDFLSRYPEIKVDLALSDSHVDLTGEGFDIAIRAQQLKDTTLVARKMFDNPMFLVVSASYLQQHGAPRTAEELVDHNCIIYSQQSTPNLWCFEHGVRISRYTSMGTSSAITAILF